MVINVQNQPVRTDAEVNELAQLLERLHQQSIAPSVAEISEATGFSEDKIHQEQSQMALERKIAALEAKIEDLNLARPKSWEQVEHDNLRVILAFLRDPGPGGRILFTSVGIALVILAFWAGIHLVAG